MTSTFWTALTASALAALTTSAGIFTIRRFTDWARRNSTYFVCFAAGVLISASFLHIVPRSMELAAEAPVYLLAGFLALHVLDRFLTVQVCDRHPEAEYAMGVVPMIGIGLHSFIDGVVYSITFTVSLFTGVVAALGMVLHEFPEGIITYVLLSRAGFSERRSALLATLAAGLSTPVGTLVSFPFISRIGDELLGRLLALSAGALVYVGATHLLPQAAEEEKRFSLVALGAGIFVAVLIVLSH